MIHHEKQQCFGSFKLVGGIAKGHPNEKDLAAAMEFYQSL